MGFFDSLFAGIGGGGILGGLSGSDQVYGRKPKPIDAPTPEDILRDASLANLASADSVRKLAADQNRFNLDQNLEMFERAAPGTGAAREQHLKNIVASLRGELSPDVTGQISRQAAARGIDRGTAGSQFDQFDELRNIGRTSLAEQQRGGINLENVLESVRKYTIPTQYDTGQSFLKPSYDPYAQFQNQLYNEKIAAAPVPAAAGAAAAQTALLESILSIYSGAPHSSGANYSNPFGGGGVSTKPYNPNFTTGAGGNQAFDEFGNFNF